MKIGVVGGTGKEGSGLAMRWARAGHDVVIGSRSAERGVSKAAELSELADAAIGGGANLDAVRNAEVAVLSVPYGAHASTLEGLKEALAGKILVDITVPLKPPKVRQVHLPDGQAAALEAKAIVGDAVTVCAALHHIGSDHLRDPNHEVDCDVLVCGEGKVNREVVIGLMADLGMRGIDAGVLRNAIALESLTPVLIHMNKRYGVAAAGLRITGILP